MKIFNIHCKKIFDSNIVIDTGICERFDFILDSFHQETHFIIITDYNVSNHYKKLINNMFNNYKHDIIISIGGEKAKNISNINKIYSDLLNNKCNRNTCLVAFGGGVIGDITGFIASTFMRGIKYINIPTSLLAMVDSSIGGKTGINLSRGKNLIGTFYYPYKVIIDPSLLKTLSRRDFYSGISEIIKYSLILDKNLFITLKNNFNQLLVKDLDSDLINQVIIRCVELKCEIVGQDAEDNNIRNILNFGHTVGHALEAFFNYDYLSHGEAVAYGMLCSSKLSNIHSNLSDIEYHDIIELINKIPLPDFRDIDIKEVIQLVMNDKKNIDYKLKFILLDSIGKAQISTSVSLKNIEEVLRNYEHINY